MPLLKQKYDVKTHQYVIWNIFFFSKATDQWFDFLAMFFPAANKFFLPS